MLEYGIFKLERLKHSLHESLLSGSPNVVQARYRSDESSMLQDNRFERC